MEKEIENRRSSSNYFLPKELALLIKIIFKGIHLIKSANLDHGNLSPSSLSFTKKGLIKISGWYVSNRSQFSSDILDAVKVIFCLATLSAFDRITNFNQQVIESNH
jgi:hypothetical protein